MTKVQGYVVGHNSEEEAEAEEKNDVVDDEVVVMKLPVRMGMRSGH